MTPIPGSATREGTQRFSKKFSNQLARDFFRLQQGLSFSSIGIGNYLGDINDQTDKQYEEALESAIKSGVNVVDTAINYRAQRSERSWGRALTRIVESGVVQRDELIVCTKGGFIPFDQEIPVSVPDYFKKEYLDHNILTAPDIIQGCHAMSPKYLDLMLSKSLTNLNLETIDIYYLHNPEIQLTEIPQPAFLKRLRAAFDWAEQKVRDGKIKFYGLATWDGFRSQATTADHLSLEEIICIAKEAGGTEHHFRAIQLPVNLAMPEAWVLSNQKYGANMVPFLPLAEKHRFAIMGSASLMQGRLATGLPDVFMKKFPQFSKPSQCALQFARSVPGMTTSLVGMKNAIHVAENLEVGKEPAISRDQLLLMFQN